MSVSVYDLAYAIAIGMTAPIWVFSPKLRRKVWDALHERNGKVLVGDGERGILIHAVSMGEINATTALIRILSDVEPRLRFTLSTTSRTGAARARELYENNPRVTRIRFPFDFSRSVGRMLDARRPAVAVLMELEVWPNFMIECEKRQIPVLLINGRLSDSSFRTYTRVGILTRPMFARLTLACVQDTAYAERFRRVGVAADRIRVTGTMKFDTAIVADRIEDADSVGKSVGLRNSEEPIWVCGSTGPGEEQIVLDAYDELRKTFSQLRLVIVPRHPERFDEVHDLIIDRGYSCLRRSSAKLADTGSLSPVRGGEGWGEGPIPKLAQSAVTYAPPLTLTLSPAYRGEGIGEASPIANAHPDNGESGNTLPIILGDTMGELRKFYSLATVVFVGRTLVDLGSKQHGSDMIEPAALAKPVIVGRFTGNFTDVMSRFRDAQAIREMPDGAQLREAVAELLQSPGDAAEMGQRAQEMVRKNQGATARHAQIILEYLQERLKAE